jgi:hypothetical protein
MGIDLKFWSQSPVSFSVQGSVHTTECRLSLDLDRLQVGRHVEGEGRIHVPARGEQELRRSHPKLTYPWGLRIMFDISIAKKVFLAVLLANLCRAARTGVLGRSH